MRTMLLPLLLAVAAPLAAQGLTPQQLMNMRDVISVAPSPDGKWIAYSVAEQRGPDEPAGPGRLTGYVMSVAGGEAREIPGAGGLSWQPGTSLICYTAKREDDEAPQLYGIPAQSGEEMRLTETPNGIRAYRWSPDGKSVAYSCLDPENELRAANQERGFKPKVVDEEFRHVSLWLWDFETKAATQLTEDMTVQAFEWAPNGERLAVAMSPKNLMDDHYVFTGIYRVDLEPLEVQEMVKNRGKLGSFAWSPDSQRLAYVCGADRNDPHAGSLGVTLSIDGTKPGAGMSIQNGMVRDVFWIDADTVGLLSDAGVRSGLHGMIPASPEPANWKPYHNLPAVEQVEPLATGGFVMVASSPTHGREVYVVEDPDSEPKRLTNSNPWLDEVELGKQEVVTFEARDGLSIEGLLIHPIGEVEGPTPLVIVVHGGPESHYRNGWVTRYSEMGQVLAGKGYRVWYPNYRASTGYGVDFAKADHGDLMGGEFNDHLDAIAHFDGLGLIDTARVGMIGGSYGGYTAAWAATKGSEHFAAAVSFVPFTDIRTKWMTTDIPYEFFYMHYQEKWPHEQAEFLAERSPLTWAENCDTPLLLVGGDADPRVHPSQPFMLYRAVKYATDTPTRYVQYPGEGHGNRMNVYRYDYLLRSLRWFDHYLSGPDRRDAALPPLDLEYPAWR